MQPGDDSLVLACRRGDASARDALVNRYQRLIYTIPRRSGLDEDQSAEVFQRTFAKLLEYLDRIEHPERIRAWLVTTARRETLQLIRQQSTERSLFDMDAPRGGIADEIARDHASLPGEELERLEEQHLIHMALETLGDRCRRLLTMLFYRPDPPSYADCRGACDPRRQSRPHARAVFGKGAPSIGSLGILMYFLSRIKLCGVMDVFGENGKKPMNPSLSHATFAQLVDLIEDRLKPGEREHVQTHLAGCAQCSSELAQLERLVGLMRADTSENAPAAVLARAINLFQNRSATISAAPDLRRRVLAALRFDSIGRAPAFGVRSGEPRARQLLFSAETHDIDLRVEPSGPSWIISGQVLGVSSAGGQVELHAETGVTRVLLNAQSEFSLPPVSAGRYKLIVHLMNVDVEVGELRIG
jgi:RNA polymerase sigma factor (sigma-70 family)